MRRVAHKAETAPGFLPPLERGGERLHHGDRTETAAAIDFEGRRRFAHQARPRFQIDVAALDHGEIRGKPRYAMAVDAAQVGPYQSIGHRRCIGRAGAGGL